MRHGIIPLLLLAVTLTGCFPRLARYDGEPAPRAERPKASPSPAIATGPASSFQPRSGDISAERVFAFIRLTNPYLDSGLARLEADAIVKHAAEKGVPLNLVVSLIATESSFNPRAVSPVGAQGLGQLMPVTAREVGVSDPFDIEQNIHGTTRYLAWLGKTWEGHPRRWEMVLASYLAGIGTVRKQLAAGRELTNEQTTYVRKIFHLSGKV